MTGKHLHRVGAYDNGAPFPSDQATWAHMLRAVGYEVVLDGKMHFIGPDTLHGFERQLTRTHRERAHRRAGVARPVPGGAPRRRHHARGGGRAGPGGEPRLRRRSGGGGAWSGCARRAGAGASPWACACFLAPHFPLVVPGALLRPYYPHNVDLPLIPPGHIEGQHPAHERGRLAYDLYDYTEEQIRRAGPPTTGW